MSSNNNNNDDSKANFRVCLRIRPLNAKEDQMISQKRHPCILKTQDNMVFLTDPNESSIRDMLGSTNQGSHNPLNSNAQTKQEKEFIFDSVFDETRSTQEVFTECISPTVDNILSGYNSTVFAYGMTGAGKTFTIFGNLYSNSNNSSNPGYSEEGISLQLLQSLHSKAKQSTTSLEFKFSYLEIYNEQIRDLMASKQENLMVVEDPQRGVFVPDLTEYTLAHPIDIKNFILQGNTKRVMASTAANQFSSRSHAIIQIMCCQKNHGDKMQVSSKLCIVDLAGSERAAATENRGMRLTEGANINRSLLALGNCINLLADASKSGSFVPYRDSKLTRLLKDSLGGNTKSIMIACVSPSSLCYDETLNTLKYASRARRIKKIVKKNEQEITEHVSQYKDIIEGLRGEIIALKGQLSLKNQENHLLRANQKLTAISTTNIPSITNITSATYNSNISLDLAICEDHHLISQSQTRVDDLSEKLFENLEEQWEIKNTIEEIIALNVKSEKFICEQQRMLDSGALSLLSTAHIDECQAEIRKRQDIIASNSVILSEMNAKLLKNAESKKELSLRIRNIYQSNPSATSIVDITGASTNDFDLLTAVAAPLQFKQQQQQVGLLQQSKQVEQQSIKDVQIAEMQKKMIELQMQLNQKDVLIMQKQNIIKNLETTVNQSSVGIKQQQQQLPQQPPMSATSARKFYMKIPKEMIVDRPATSNQTAISTPIAPIQNLQSNRMLTSIPVSVSSLADLIPQSSVAAINKPMRDTSSGSNMYQKEQLISQKRHATSTNKIGKGQQQSTLSTNTTSTTTLNIKGNSSNAYTNPRTPVAQKKTYSGTSNAQQTGSSSNLAFGTSNSSLIKSNPSNSNTQNTNNNNRMEISISELKTYAQKLRGVDFTTTTNPITAKQSTAGKDSFRAGSPTSKQQILPSSTAQPTQLTSQQADRNPLRECNQVPQTAARTTIGVSPCISPYLEQQKPQQQQLSQQNNIQQQQQPRSLSCLRLGGGNSGIQGNSSGAQEMELNSYALARKKMREFKEKLTLASEKPQNFSNQDLNGILKEFQLQTATRNGDDEKKAAVIEAFLAKSSTPASQAPQQTAAQSALSNRASNCFSERENVQPLIIAAGNHSQIKKVITPFSNSGEQMQLNYSQQSKVTTYSQKLMKQTSLQTEKQSQKAQVQQQQQQSNNENSCSGINSFVNAASKKFLPRGMLSSINSNYAETVSYSKKACSTNSTTPLSQSTNRNREKSPISTRNKEQTKQAARKPLQDNFSQQFLNGGSCKIIPASSLNSMSNIQGHSGVSSPSSQHSSSFTEQNFAATNSDSQTIV